MKLETNRLILRDYKKSDFKRVHIYASFPSVSQYSAWGPNTEEETLKFISDAIKKSQKKLQYEFELAIILKEANLLIGGCELKRDWEKGSVANLGYIINPDFQRKGYATEAATKLISFGFEKMSLAVIYATCDTRNKASFKVMENLGMKKVGHIKNHKEIKGQMRDSYCYEILNPIVNF